MPLVIQLLPSWRAVLDGVDLGIKGKKAQALMVYLAFSRATSHNRDTIGPMLWPNGTAAAARGSLRQAVAQLRRAVGDDADALLDAGRETIGFMPGVLQTDFETILEELTSGPVLPHHKDWLAQAKTALRQFYGISPEFDDWISTQTDWMADQLMTRLEDRFLPDTEAPEQRLKLASLAISLDAFNERAVQTQMRCHAQMNDNAAALRVYRDFFERLDDELGGEPSVETTDLVAQIKLSGQPAEVIPTQAIPAAAPAQVSYLPKLAMVAVLPFERLGPTDISDFQLLALLDQITCKMAGFKSPGVISSNSTRHYLNRNPLPAEIQRDLGAHYVVTGSLSVAGQRVHMSVQMSNTADNRIHWATTLSVHRDQLLAESALLADQIALAIEPSLNVAELERAEVLPPELLEPHHYVLRAKNLMFSMAKPDFDEAKRVLDVVETKHPHFGPGHALLAEWYAINLWQGWTTRPEVEKTLLEQHSRRSVALSPHNGRSLALWGHNKFLLMDRDYDSCFRLLDQAMRLSPNDSETLIWTVPTFAYGGRPQLALENAQKAFSLSPADPFLFRNEHFLSVAHYVNGNFDDAARLGLSCFRRAPNYGSNTRATIASLVSLGRTEDARQLVAHHNSIAPDFSVTAFKGSHGYRDPNAREDYAQKLLVAGLPD